MLPNSESLTDTVLMIRPQNFGFNPEIALDNAFQISKNEDTAGQINQKAQVQSVDFKNFKQGWGAAHCVTQVIERH